MGMLIAKTILPEGPSDGKIKEGDVLIKINRQILTKFPFLDEILDSSVGESVSLDLQRGPETVTVAVGVEDLHKITPGRYISAAGRNFHGLSFQKAHAYNRACKGVFVSGAVGSFNAIPGHIILKTGDKDTPDLDHFQAVIKSIPDRARIVVRYMSLQDQNIDEIIIRIDHWTGPMVLAARQGYSDIWDKTIFAEPLRPTLPTALSGSFSTPEILRYPGKKEILQSLITVHFTTPIGGNAQWAEATAGIVSTLQTG